MYSGQLIRGRILSRGGGAILRFSVKTKYQKHQTPSSLLLLSGLLTLAMLSLYCFSIDFYLQVPSIHSR